MITCESCNFWEKIEYNNFKEAGYCHRYPPQVVGDSDVDFFPIVKKDSWCGEWKEKGSE